MRNGADLRNIDWFQELFSLLPEILLRPERPVVNSTAYKDLDQVLAS